MRREMEAYIVLLHLVSQGHANFTDIQYLLGWDEFQRGPALDILVHINERLPDLSSEWSEEIPHINAFVFDRHGKCTSYVCNNIFDCGEEQPSSQQITEYAKKIAAYPNWNKVLEVFRQEAFQ